MTARTGPALAACCVVLCVVAGCASPEPDGVLWRQMDRVKQPVFRAFNDTLGMDRAVLLEDIVSAGGVFPGSYESSGGDRDPRRGGVFLSGLVEGGEQASVSVLISSGPRDPGADPLAGEGAYNGPPSVYTCFDAVVEFADDRVFDWSWDEEAVCDPFIVAALDTEAEFMPLYELAG